MLWLQGVFIVKKIFLILPVNAKFAYLIYYLVDFLKFYLIFEGNKHI